MSKARSWYQLDLFGAPEVEIDARTGEARKKKAPATATNSPGAVATDQRRINGTEAYRRLAVRKQAIR